MSAEIPRQRTPQHESVLVPASISTDGFSAPIRESELVAGPPVKVFKITAEQWERRKVVLQELESKRHAARHRGGDHRYAPRHAEPKQARREERVARAAAQLGIVSTMVGLSITGFSIYEATKEPYKPVVPVVAARAIPAKVPDSVKARGKQGITVVDGMGNVTNGVKVGDDRFAVPSEGIATDATAAGACYAPSAVSTEHGSKSVRSVNAVGRASQLITLMATRDIDTDLSPLLSHRPPVPVSDLATTLKTGTTVYSVGGPDLSNDTHKLDVPNAGLVVASETSIETNSFFVINNVQHDGSVAPSSQQEATLNTGSGVYDEDGVLQGLALAGIYTTEHDVESLLGIDLRVPSADGMYSLTPVIPLSQPQIAEATPLINNSCQK